MNRAAHSFFAAFAGWLIPFVGYLAWLQFDERGFGYITDFEFLLFWPLLFTAIGWLVVGLPIAISLGRAAVPGIGKVILISTAATTATFLCIAALFQIGLMTLIWWPVLIGLIGGIVYWLLQRSQPLRGWVFWSIPVLFFPFVRFVVLPIGIAFFPYTTHVLAEGAIGREALIGVIKRIEVGDTYQELHRRYPQIFYQPVLGISSSGGGCSYSIQFDDTRARVVKVEIISETNSEQIAPPNP
jgi:hypothetical protein